VIQPPVVSFIIPVRNDAVRLERCLQSIRSNHYPCSEIVVADNGSTDRSVSVARAAGANVVSLPGVRLGELRNRGVASSRGDVLAFIDADHEIAPDWTASVVAALAQESVAAVGAPYRPPASATWVQRQYDRLRRHPGGQEVVDWLASGNMAVRRKAFELVDGFDVSLETCEDVDLCRKLRARGYVVLADGRLRNVHHGDPTTLRHVFLGELWRGRDNVRVSLRAPRSWRTIASALVPIATLLALLVAVAGLASATVMGRSAAVWASLFILSLLGLRAARMTAGGAFRELPRALAVAAAYELGRALAVAARTGYGRRRKDAVA
jgi:GT2 family glycosyltransferase